MTAQAAHLVEAVLPQVPCRQWVLTLPYRLRYILAWDHALGRAVLAVYLRALLGFQRRKARSRDVEGRGGAVTVIQRFGSALNLNVHFHTLVLDGVSSPSPNDSERAAIDDEAAAAVPDPEDQAAPAAAQSLAAKRAWAHLMRRAFDFDVLACPRCGGRMRLLATIDNPTVVRRILTSLGLSTEIPEPFPARSPPDTDTPTLFDTPAH